MIKRARNHTPRPLIVDFDSTITNSSKAICDVYNNKIIPLLIKLQDMRGTICNKELLTPADWTKVNRWNFTDECKLFNDKLTAIDVFDSIDFFNVLEFFPHAKESLERLSEITKIIICSSGTPKNISHKVLWIEKHLPFADIVPVIVHGSDGYGKSIVNMEGAVFIDDRADNLETSNAHYKICYGNDKPWNKDYKGMCMNQWDKNAVDNIVNMILDDRRG